jgi:hypothetical protein
MVTKAMWEQAVDAAQANASQKLEWKCQGVQFQPHNLLSSLIRHNFLASEVRNVALMLLFCNAGDTALVRTACELRISARLLSCR